MSRSTSTTSTHASGKQSGRILMVVLTALLLALALPAAASAATYTQAFTNTDDVTIPTVSTVPLSLDVSGPTSPVTDVNVGINGLNHTYLWDLTVSLVGPTGQTVTLFSYLNASGAIVDADMVFDDAAAIPVTSAIPPYGGTFRPQGSLAAFNNLDPSGVWRLVINNPCGLDHGSLTRGWTLELTVDDVTAPETTAGVSPSPDASGWYTADPTVALNATDSDSGIASTQYRRSGESEWATYTGPFAVSEEGETTWEYRSTDGVGNVEDAKIVTVKLDRSPPTIAAAGNSSAWRTKPVTLKFKPTAVSGVAKVEYKFGSGAWKTLAKKGGAWQLTVSKKGKTVVSYRATSVAGTRSAIGTCTVKIDGKAPTLKLANKTLNIWMRSRTTQNLRLLWNDGDSTSARLRVVVTQYGSKRQQTFSAKLTRRGKVQTIALPWQPKTPGRYFLHLTLTDESGRSTKTTVLIRAHR